MSKVEQRLADLGLELPPDWTPRGAFLPFRTDGTTVHLSGQICERDGAVTHVGPVPDTPEGIEAAREACDLFVSIGTSGAVYPAAGFVNGAKARGARTLELNLEPSEGTAIFHEARHGPAGQLVPEWVEEVLAA